MLVKNPIYLMVANSICKSCKHWIHVYGIIAYQENAQYTDLPIRFSEVTFISKEVLQVIQHFSPEYKRVFSKTTGENYYANTCPHCEEIISDFDLHNGPEGIFNFICSYKYVSLFTIDCLYPIQITGNLNFKNSQSILKHASNEDIISC